jgi:anti-anti-sigma factor
VTIAVQEVIVLSSAWPGAWLATTRRSGSRIRLRDSRDAVISLELSGAIDEPSTSELQHVLVDLLLRRRPDRVVIDLRRTTFLDPTAVGVLLAAVDTADDVRVGLSLCNPSPHLANQLLGAGLPSQRVTAAGTPTTSRRSM